MTEYKVSDAGAKHRYYSEIKTRHLARMDRDWDGLEETSLLDGDSVHNFSSDLNLLGPRSLHHLLDTSFTREGSDLLATWLTEPTPELTNILNRQSMVRELTPLAAFRDRLNLLSGLVTKDPSAKWDGALLLKWLASHVDRGRMLPVLVLLSTLAVTTVGLIGGIVFVSCSEIVKHPCCHCNALYLFLEHYQQRIMFIN